MGYFSRDKFSRSLGGLKKLETVENNDLAELFFCCSLRIVPEGAEYFQQIFQGVLKGLVKIDLLLSVPENCYAFLLCLNL